MERIDHLNIRRGFSVAKDLLVPAERIVEIPNWNLKAYRWRIDFGRYRTEDSYGGMAEELQAAVPTRIVPF